MRTLLLTFLLIGTLSSAAFAQRRDRYAERPGDTDPSIERVDEVTRQMSTQLHLNEAQFIKLREVNKVKLARLEEIQWQYVEDGQLRNAKIAELEAQYEAECGRILTPSQLSLFREEQKRDSTPTGPANSNEGGLG
ncbi:hypothetical protein MUN84_22295 [Hymenobacter sp. 5516J-16]|uniref:DUF4890 domain-containing protein n=1 Tax=Hymenobacter sublimis TaxID=2933777 RepID=A0ABY4JHN5_9BACT|nr:MULTISPECIES: hypothetical protein [Hymenobacter]UOQ77144.1 hypothetical protein MUN84_22295 [Hymenobacter sp. 5516J-16]UPL50834.1 hypothetical protein MWH26_07995 [Hymenobacter sublimis]